MVANKNSDMASCTSVAEAFAHPLPQIRQIHRNLADELDEKKYRLRNAVGGNYRQLLGTAETILEMSDMMQTIEEKLGRIGQACAQRTVENKSSSLVRLHENHKKIKIENNLHWWAQTKSLEMCAVIMGRLLRKKDVSDESRAKSLVTAAKVFVISRLLTGSLGETLINRDQSDQYLVEKIGKKLEILRLRLLNAIDQILRCTTLESREILVQALVALSLITDLGAEDVLKHFLCSRMEAMATLSTDSTVKRNEKLVKALILYAMTLYDMKTILPRRLTENLAVLKVNSLLMDKTIRDLEELRLDEYDKWFRKDIIQFTPRMRHDDVDGAQAAGLLEKWDQKAVDVLIQGIVKALESENDLKTVVEMRTKMLEVWLKEGNKVRGLDLLVRMDRFRSSLNSRIYKILELRIGMLKSIGMELETTISSWKTGVHDKPDSLWDSSALNIDVSNGAEAFKQMVLSRMHGRNDSLSKTFKKYQSWLRLYDETVTIISQIKRQRWEDCLEDISNDVGPQMLNDTLSVEDAQLLENHLRILLRKAFEELHKQIEALLHAIENRDHISQISAYLIRIVRDVRSEFPDGEVTKNFGVALLTPLREKMVPVVVKDHLPTFVKSACSGKIVGRSLWEGDPQLPLQPSPAAFKLIFKLVQTMGELGGDLWCPATVLTLKKYVARDLSYQWAQALQITADETGEHSCLGVDFDANDNSAKELMIQAMFDYYLILKNVFSAPNLGSETTAALEVLIGSRADLNSELQLRIFEASKEYWKRTSLLFGLLM
ncbi:sphingolipid C9-methyltransferase [Blumeria hordei DH14]|uniref:Conserved oligomeric Golgi complex subunit 1 n=1 Tax=Blumeria graminis f. sp. hordei (strain DH14) TaxID=546991 RepID=N1J895_BLUG1|nr:sphingolipid C9-methyltransferase [Blumeria hordei DH14]